MRSVEVMHVTSYHADQFDEPVGYRMEKVVWIISCKVKILRSSPLAMDDSTYAAAEAATFAYSEEDAHSQLLQQVQNAKLELIEGYQCSPLCDENWFLSATHKDDIFQLVEEVKFSGEFRFGVFRC